jgi:hypothetical protein
VEVTITSPTGVLHTGFWQANKIGWVFDPTFDLLANEPGRWTVDVFVEHDQPYVGNGTTPQSHNTGTVLGTSGSYEFYVVQPGAPRLNVVVPQPGFITWPHGGVDPIEIHIAAPTGTTDVLYTIHDKGVVMGQGTLIPLGGGEFILTYDAKALNVNFPFLSLTSHEGLWEGLADEVAINLLAIGGVTPQANTVTLIGEEVFIGSGEMAPAYLPAILSGGP